MGNSEVLCWAAKWYGEEWAYHSSTHLTSKRKMLQEMYDMLNEADAVVTYNGNGFDLKILNKEFALMGWAPPAPYKSIDLLKTVRKQFRFTSNKLNYVAQQFKLGKKAEHRGHQLWLDCMAGDEDAWLEMEEYNLQDVWLLEDLYTVLLPWITNHPNRSAFDDKLCCTNCGSTRYQLRGWAHTKMLKYRRAQCKDCGTWIKSTKAEPRETTERFVQLNAN